MRTCPILLSLNAVMEELVLVDENDAIVGYEEKLSAHKDGGRLHRAFSVFIRNSAGQLLLQRRAKSKYHFPGVWTNTCCSHPLRGEVLEEAVRKRLKLEMGIEAELTEVDSFVYRAEDASSGLVEHEFDHVFLGEYDADPSPNADEADGFKWCEVAELSAEIEQNPGSYSPWLRVALARLIERGVLRIS